MPRQSPATVILVVQVTQSVIMMTTVTTTVTSVYVEDFMTCLQDEDIEPHAEVGGNHVHQTKAGQELVLVDVHLETSEDLFYT